MNIHGFVSFTVIIFVSDETHECKNVQKPYYEIKNIFRFWGNGVNSKLKPRKALKVDFILQDLLTLVGEQGIGATSGRVIIYDWLSTAHLGGGMGKEGAVSANFTYSSSLPWPRHKLLSVLCAVCCVLCAVCCVLCAVTLLWWGSLYALTMLWAIRAGT